MKPLLIPLFLCVCITSSAKKYDIQDRNVIDFAEKTLTEVAVVVPVLAYNEFTFFNGDFPISKEFYLLQAKDIVRKKRKIEEICFANYVMFEGQYFTKTPPKKKSKYRMAKKRLREIRRLNRAVNADPDLLTGSRFWDGIIEFIGEVLRSSSEAYPSYYKSMYRDSFYEGAPVQ